MSHEILYEFTRYFPSFVSEKISKNNTLPTNLTARREAAKCLSYMMLAVFLVTFLLLYFKNSLYTAPVTLHTIIKPI